MRILAVSLELELANSISKQFFEQYREAQRVLDFLEVFQLNDRDQIYGIRRCNNLADLTHCLRKILTIIHLEFDRIIMVTSEWQPSCAVYINRLLRSRVLVPGDINIIKQESSNGRKSMARFHCWSLFGDRKNFPMELGSEKAETFWTKLQNLGH